LSGGDHKVVFEAVIGEIVDLSLAHYGDRLVSLVLFGSIGRGSHGPESDIDLLVIADPLPRGRLLRVSEFTAAVEDGLTSLERARNQGVHTRVSPIFKTRSEAAAGSPLFLDMTEDARMLLDRDGFFEKRLDLLRARLKELGSRRIWKGGSWYWILKPDLQPGEVFDL